MNSYNIHTVLVQCTIFMDVFWKIMSIPIVKCAGSLNIGENVKFNNLCRLYSHMLHNTHGRGFYLDLNGTVSLQLRIFLALYICWKYLKDSFSIHATTDKIS